MLSGKVAVVTGAGSGIGGAICLSFAQAGAKLACINEFAAAETAAACGRHALVGRRIHDDLSVSARESPTPSREDRACARHRRRRCVGSRQRAG
ncbi:MAG: SDR family NAD(P)-dependent oxidoreductase [Xanthobacteraceae bacterium]